MAVFGNRGEASLRNHIGRPSREQIRACSGILSDALSGRQHRSQQLSFTALSSRSIFIFLWIRLLLIHKTYALSSTFSIYHGKKLACFYEPQFGRISPNISLSDFLLATKLLQATALDSTCRTISVCKLLEIVNFHGLWTLMVWHFWQL